MDHEKQSQEILLDQNNTENDDCFSCCCVIKTIFYILLFPIAFAFYLLIIVFWLIATLTCIGPCIQHLFSRRDSERLSQSQILGQHSDCHIVETRGHRLMVRFTVPTQKNENKRFYPICIPNGMGSTLAMIGKLHDQLVRNGFTVLSYDRLGTGFSDENNSNLSPTVEETLQDMDAVMCDVMPPDQQWIIIGPSMGSIVGQCYVSKFPQKVVGFLNLDGVPYPFFRKRKLFNTFGKVYVIESKLTWTGIFRPFIYMFKSKLAKFSGDTFSVDLLKAQANEAKFFKNIGLEMKLMMDCCEFANIAWGEQSVTDLDPSKAIHLISAKPTRNGDENAQYGTWDEYEQKSWASIDNTNGVVHDLLEKKQSELTQTWKGMVVRVMSGRNYDFPMSKWTYDYQMRDWIASEHAIHSLFAVDGQRDIFPTKTHFSMFAGTIETTVFNTIAISNKLEEKLN